MIAFVVFTTLACDPQPNRVCTREFRPVCAENVEFSNYCVAQAAGYNGECENLIRNGPCRQIRNPSLTCKSTEFFSEKGLCVTKPWSDFISCEVEKNQGACPQGADPNPFIGEHCSVTCAS